MHVRSSEIAQTYETAALIPTAAGLGGSMFPFPWFTTNTEIRPKFHEGCFFLYKIFKVFLSLLMLHGGGEHGYAIGPTVCLFKLGIKADGYS